MGVTLLVELQSRKKDAYRSSIVYTSEWSRGRVFEFFDKNKSPSVLIWNLCDQD